MKKAILTIALFSVSLSFAKSGDPIIKHNDNFLKSEKTTKDEKAEKQHQIQIKSLTKKASESALCFSMATIPPPVGPGVGIIPYCFALYNAGF